MRLVIRLVPFAILIAVGLLVTGCQKAITKEVTVPVTREVEKIVTQQVEVTRVVNQVVTKEVPKEPSGDIPFASAWVSSGHADTQGEPFNHWNEADPQAVPKDCAKCHSTYGFQDFTGADGTAAGVVDNDAKIGSVITCVACHNDATIAMDSVTFPSGAVVSGLGKSARCVECHEGRASMVQVNASIEKAGATELDQVNPNLSFINAHYFTAGATEAGGLAMAGYQYDGKSYDVRFAHVNGLNGCVDCHDPHSLDIKIDTCAECHTNVKSEQDLPAIRMAGSQADYDGDGNVQEGIAQEIEGLQALLYQAIQAYGSNVAGTAIVYSADSYPYFFIDTNKNGQLDADEAKSANKYNAWTPRLVKAAYNYQFSIKDPGGFAHGGKYIIELLYDSIDDLNQALSQPVDLSAAHRIDPGHFAGSEEAFRHWDAEGEVPGTCSKCHSADGLPFYLKEGVTASQELSNGLECTTCHDAVPGFTRYQVKAVTFPSGAVIDSGNSDTNLCMTCHQGRESTVSVNKQLNGLEPDTVSDKLRFQNVHYFAAGATLFGTEAKGAYEYPNKTYAGRNEHVSAYSNCTDCHDTHSLTVKVEACAGCHQGISTAEDLTKIRMSKVDYDGDGNTQEGIAEEIRSYYDMVYKAMQDYAVSVTGNGILYDGNQYPYFFVDKNNNGAIDDGEAVSDNAFKTWTPRLLQAAYNYQYVTKDPGAYAHNSTYILQVLYDTLQDLGAKVPVNMQGLQRAG